MPNLTKNQWLVTVFALFLVTVCAYGGCYYAIYCRDHTSFYFQEALAREQERNAVAGAQYRVELLTRQKELLAQLARELAAGRLPEVKQRTLVDKAILSSVLSTADAHYEFAVGFRLMPPPYGEEGRMLPYPMLTVYEVTSGKQLGQWSSDESDILAGTADDYSAVAGRFAASIASDLARALSNQQLVARGERHWSYWDFLYFSVITASTVGYGDILPNRTLVRLVIASQVILSSFLLVVVINIALRQPRQRGAATPNKALKLTRHCCDPVRRRSLAA